MIVGTGKFSGLRIVIEGSSETDTFWKFPRSKLRCGVETSRNWARSGVEMIILAFATLRQCFKVASVKSVLLLVAESFHTSQTGIDQTSHGAQF